MARGRPALPSFSEEGGAIATTTPGLVISWICTLKSVPEASAVNGPRPLLRPTAGVESPCDKTPRVFGRNTASTRG